MPHEYEDASERADAIHGVVPELNQIGLAEKPRGGAAKAVPQTPPPAAGDAAEAQLSQPGAAPGTPATRDAHISQEDTP